MRLMFLLGIPLLGVLWFVNFTTFLKNLKNNKRTHIQTVFGIALTFVFIFFLLFLFL